MDFISGKFNTNEDAFKGVKPIFIYDANTPEKLTFVWGASKTVPRQVFPDEALDATIVYKSEDMITAVYVDRQGAVEVFSLYPKIGVVYFTQHKSMLFATIATTASFGCECVFKYSGE